MKKIIVILLSILLVSACGCVKVSARGAVEAFLDQYKNLSSSVLSSLEDEVDSEVLTDSQKDVYREVLKRQYQDLTYTIDSEIYNGDDAEVTATIKVYDLYGVQVEAEEYLLNHEEEFLTDGLYDADLFMDYKLDKMLYVNDTVEYTIYFNVSKDEDGNFQVVDITEEILNKIHGIYNYDITNN